MLQVHEYNKQPLVTKHYPKGIKPKKHKNLACTETKR